MNIIRQTGTWITNKLLPVRKKERLTAWEKVTAEGKAVHEELRERSAKSQQPSESDES
jgi:hypothetical protein